jgi:hypothetical protein
VRNPGLRQSQRLAPLADDGAQVGQVDSLACRSVGDLGHSCALEPNPPGARQRRRRMPPRTNHEHLSCNSESTAPLSAVSKHANGRPLF